MHFGRLERRVTVPHFSKHSPQPRNSKRKNRLDLLNQGQLGEAFTIRPCVREGRWKSESRQIFSFFFLFRFERFWLFRFSAIRFRRHVTFISFSVGPRSTLGHISAPWRVFPAVYWVPREPIPAWWYFEGSDPKTKFTLDFYPFFSFFFYDFGADLVRGIIMRSSEMKHGKGSLQNMTQSPLEKQKNIRN